jgi:hypothetical protein
MKTLFILRDCSEFKCIYGILSINANVNYAEVQNAINDIKSSMSEDLQSSFTIDKDILPKLPWKTELIEISTVTV